MAYATRKDSDAPRLNLLEQFVRCPLFRSKGRQHSRLTITGAILILSILLWDGDPWKYEGAINDLVGKFIKSLPKE